MYSSIIYMYNVHDIYLHVHVHVHCVYIYMYMHAKMYTCTRTCTLCLHTKYVHTKHMNILCVWHDRAVGLP